MDTFLKIIGISVTSMFIICCQNSTSRHIDGEGTARKPVIEQAELQ